MRSARSSDERRTPRWPTGPTYVYVTYIHSTPERVWDALTDADLTASYWGHSNVSDWEPGSRWEHRRTDGSGIADVVGTVLEADPPDAARDHLRLPRRRGRRGGLAGDLHDRAVTRTSSGSPSSTRTSPRTTSRPSSAGWPAVLSNLKSLLETGHVLPQAPWEMHAELRDAQMAANDPR